MQYNLLLCYIILENEPLLKCKEENNYYINQAELKLFEVCMNISCYINLQMLLTSNKL